MHTTKSVLRLLPNGATLIIHLLFFTLSRSYFQSRDFQSSMAYNALVVQQQGDILVRVETKQI